MRVGIAGASSTISLEFCAAMPRDHGVYAATLAGLPLDLDRYLICTGYLAGRSLGEISPHEADLTWELNFLAIAQFCEELFAKNQTARVVVMGSESGFAGSYDMAYAAAKSALHLYVERKELGPEQMLVALAPHIILDSGMTQRRDDILGLIDRGAEENRLGRWLNAKEVAGEALHLLFDASLAMSGQVIRLRP